MRLHTKYTSIVAPLLIQLSSLFLAVAGSSLCPGLTSFETEPEDSGGNLGWEFRLGTNKAVAKNSTPIGLPDASRAGVDTFKDEPFVSTLHLKGMMTALVSLEGDGSSPRALTHIFEGVVHAKIIGGTAGNTRLAIYFERFWELSLIGRHNLVVPEATDPNREQFSAAVVPNHVGSKRVPVGLVKSLLGQPDASIAQIQDADVDQAQWYVSGLSGKVVHLTCGKRVLAVEPQDCTLTKNELFWVYDTELPELIWNHAAGSTVSAADMAMSINQFIPTNMSFLRARDGNELAEKTACGETRQLVWNVQPYAIETKFPSLLLLGSPFTVKQAGKASLCYRRQECSLDELNPEVRTRLED